MDFDKIYKVKVSTQDTCEMLLRQSPHHSGKWRNYQFFINEDNEEADFWVVYGKGRCMNETCRVPRENLIFGSGEPDAVYLYSDKFIKQFNTVFAASEAIAHPRKIITQPALAWYIGVSFSNEGNEMIGKRIIMPDSDYDYFKMHKPIEKTKLLSVMCSTRAYTKGHLERLAFVEKLKDHFGNRLDIYGRGFKSIDDKWKALKDYKYHIVIENNRCDHYWTEKIADAFLGGCYPLYYGCPNIGEYFPENSYTPIDITRPEEAIATIENAINNHLADRNKAKMIEATDLVLDKYNFFNVVADICDKLNPEAPKDKIYLRHELDYKNWKKVEMYLSRLYYKFKYLRK